MTRIQVCGSRRARRLAAALLAGCVWLMAGACGGPPLAGAAPLKCGLGTGMKATGEPITLGGIFTRQPGVDFTGIAGMAQAYFACVNDNGGINNRPIRYIVETEQTNPAQVAALASRLIDQDHVLAIVGSTSLIDCAVNHQLYEQRGYNVIVAGVPFECFSTPNITAVNMGPYYSNLGAAQYLVRQGVKTLVVLGTNVPGGDHDISSVTAYAKASNIASGGAFLVNVPMQDATVITQRVVQAAGEGGGVVINLTPPEGLKVLQAAEQLNLVDRVRWAWDTPGNDASVVQALGGVWDGKLGVNAELNLVESNGPDNLLYRRVTSQYAPSVPLGSFGQMGFLAAEIITKTLLQLPPDQLNMRDVNAAIRRIKDFKTDILCKPWYFGDLPYHVANNADRTVTPHNHAFALREDCFDIAPLTGNNLDDIRQAEKRQGLNRS